MSIDFLKLKHPFTAIVAGGTSSGKTVWVRKLLKNWQYLIKISKNYIKVLWCYGIRQKLHDEQILNVEVTYHPGIPSLDTIKKARPDIIVLDDLMIELKKDERVKNLFTRGSHHLNISVIFLTQNIFSNDSSMRTMSLNCHYTVAMKSIRNRDQILRFCGQIWRKKTSKIEKIINNAHKKNFSYIIFDLHPQLIDERFRIRNEIFRDEQPKILRKLYYSTPVFYPINDEN